MSDGERLTSTLTIIDESSNVLNAIEAACVSASAALDGVISHLGVLSGVKLPGIRIGDIDGVSNFERIAGTKNTIDRALPGVRIPDMRAADGVGGYIRQTRIPDISGIGRATDEASKKIRSVGDASEHTYTRSQSAFSRIASDLAHVTHAAQGVYTVLSKIGSLSIQGISTGDDIAKTSRALHINAQAYQELGYAAQRGGASQEGFVQGLKVLDRQLAQLNNGSTEVAAAFRQIGLSRKDLAGKDLEQSLYAISDALSQMEDKGNAAKAAQVLLGAQGYRTASAFSVGVDELDRLRQEAREIGIIMDDMTLSLAEQGDDELLNVQLHIQSIWQRISIAIMPAVVRVLERIDDLFKENSSSISQIASYFGQLASNVLPVVMQLISTIMLNVRRVFDSVVPYIGPVIDFISTVSDGVTILVDRFGDMILTVRGVVGALYAVRTAMLAIAANPVMAVIAGTVAIISFIEGMRKKSEEFYAATQKIGIGIAMGLDVIARSFVGAFQTAGNAIGRVWSAITGAVMSAFGATLGWLADKWNAFVKWIGLEGLDVDASFANEIEKSGYVRMDEATDTSRDFYFDASGTFDALSKSIDHGMSMMSMSGQELGWKPPTEDILSKMDEQMNLASKNNAIIMGRLNGGVKIDKDSILFMKEMATAEVINRYNNISPNISQNFNSDRPFEPEQIEKLSGSAIDGAMAGMRAAI